MNVGVYIPEFLVPELSVAARESVSVLPAVSECWLRSCVSAAPADLLSAASHSTEQKTEHIKHSVMWVEACHCQESMTGAK